MAEHIEVVIKIPKYYLTHPQDYSCLAECVRRGVPLPKGHGRLIDADKLYDDYVREPEEFNGGRSLMNLFREAETIIEADEVESEG